MPRKRKKMGMPRVLVIDDDQDDLVICESILREGNFEVITTSRYDIHYLQTLIDHNRPDLVLLDRFLPPFEDGEILEFLGQQEPPLAVILTSGELDGIDQNVLVKAFVKKGCPAEQLVEVVRNVLQ